MCRRDASLQGSPYKKQNISIHTLLGSNNFDPRKICTAPDKGWKKIPLNCPQRVSKDWKESQFCIKSRLLHVCLFYVVLLHSEWQVEVLSTYTSRGRDGWAHTSDSNKKLGFYFYFLMLPWLYELILQYKAASSKTI